MKPQPRYQPGDRIGGRYEVHKALMGGMGEVYLCLDLEEDYPLALKTFQQRYLTDTQRLREAFEHEVATWVALEKHPNIVRCFWMQTFDNQPFMALEWIAGEEDKGTDLRSWLRRGPLDLKLALQVVIDICNGLLYAQTKQPGLVHRDLKPENILMAQGGLAKITDFGLAQVVQTAGLETNQEQTRDSRYSLIGKRGIAGTPTYMAPEQWRGEELDTRSDIYALGCILYELLNGSSPFTAYFTPTTPQQMAQWLAALQLAHESQPAPRLSAPFTPALDALVQCCLRKRQHERPQNLVELVNQLAQLYKQQFDQFPPLRPNSEIFTAGDYNNRGNTYSALNLHHHALADFGQAIILAPNDAVTYSNRGVTWMNLEEYDKALADFTQAIQLNPSNAPSYHNRALLFEKLDHDEDALADYAKAIELDPNFIQAYTHRADMYIRRQQWEKALIDLTQLLILDATNVRAYIHRANVSNQLGYHEDALTDLTNALTLDSNNSLIYYNIGNTYGRMQRHKEALTYHNRAIALDPTDALAYYNRGATHLALQDIDATQADYEQALALNPQMSQAHVGIGIISARKGAWKQAMIRFEAAAQLGSSEAEAHLQRVQQEIALLAKRQ